MGYGTLVSLVFHNLPSLYPSSFCRNDFLYLYNVTGITKHSSALYIGMAKVLPIIDVLGYDGQNSSFSSSPPPPPPPPPPPYSDSTPITQKRSHISP